MNIGGAKIDVTKLLTQKELFDFFEKEGENYSALSNIRDKYEAEFGVDLIWGYPYSDGISEGVTIVAVQEGFLGLPYNSIDLVKYEEYKLDQANLLSADELRFFIQEYETKSVDLLRAMNDMINVLEPDATKGN